MVTLLKSAGRFFTKPPSRGDSRAPSPPGSRTRAMSSSGVDGCPRLPDATQAAAGCLTCSSQKAVSSDAKRKTAVQGRSGSQSAGRGCPAETALAVLRRILS
eukprot:14340109-Heterocapsa_arctica.AAC.1